MTKESTNPKINSQSEEIEKNTKNNDKNHLDEEESNEELSVLKIDKDLMQTPVLLKSKAYKRIYVYAMRYASDDINEKNWREVYGILIGSIEGDYKLIIKDAIPMVVGDRAGVKYENKQYVDMAQIDESVYERSIRDKKNDFIVGWWHTHPGFPFQFSNIDHQTQLGYQIPNPLAIGLIFNHCKLKSRDFYLGIAALRILDPERGMWSPYNYIECLIEDENSKFLKKIEKSFNTVKKNLPKALRAIKYIDDILRKKALAQLQRNYGLILIPKKDIIITKDEIQAEDDDKYLYEWDPEFFKKSYRIPKFREKIEKEIKRYEESLVEILEANDKKKYKHKKQKYRKKIQHHLMKPNEWYAKMMREYSKKIEDIYPFYDYLDTNERKVLEHFESRSSEYNKILESLNKRALLKVKKDLKN